MYYTPRKQDMRFHPFLSRLPHTLVHKPYRFRCTSLPFLLGMCFTSKRFLITSSLSASNFRRSIFPSRNRLYLRLYMSELTVVSTLFPVEKLGTFSKFLNYLFSLSLFRGIFFRFFFF